MITWRMCAPAHARPRTLLGVVIYITGSMAIVNMVYFYQATKKQTTRTTQPELNGYNYGAAKSLLTSLMQPRKRPDVDALNPEEKRLVENILVETSLVFDRNGSDSTAHNGLSKGLLVPNIVHTIWFYPPNTTFAFHHAMSMLSIFKFVKPKHIYFWFSNLPKGKWWQYTYRRVPNIVLGYRKAPESVFGRVVRLPEHQSDVARLELLIEHGGIYLDLDTIVVRSLRPLQYYQTTLGAEGYHSLGNGVILAAPRAPFLRVWYGLYKTLNDSVWNYHSVRLPMKLARHFPHWVHIEWESLLRPSWTETAWLYDEGKLWDWEANYAVHLWSRFHKEEYDPLTIRNLNSTAGELFRLVYYGISDLKPLKIQNNNDIP